MKIRLPVIAAMVLAVCTLAIPPGGASAQQGDDAAASRAALPKDPAVVSCLETILYGDLAYVNYDEKFPPTVRRECLQWLKARAGAQLEAENKQRKVALSLDDEIKRNLAGAAAARAAKIANAQSPFQDDDEFLSSRPRPPSPPNASGNAGALPDRQPATHQAGGQNVPSRAGDPGGAPAATDGAASAALLKTIASPFDPTQARVVYYPMIAFGLPSAKKKVLVIWDFSQRSADGFKKYVLPLIVATRGHPDRLVVMLESLTSLPDGAHRPGAAFFCAANPRQYLSLVLRYMSDKSSDRDAIRPSTADPKLAINGAAERALAAEKIDFASCLRDQMFYQRAVFGTVYTAKLEDHFGVKSAPAFIWHDQAMPVDAKTLRQIKQSWR